ncbi:hypothetical protein ACWD6N_31755 [Micromonospora sp. NPDC005163]
MAPDLEVAGLGEAMALFQPPPGQVLAETATVEVRVAGTERQATDVRARLARATRSPPA